MDCAPQEWPARNPLIQGAGEGPPLRLGICMLLLLACLIPRIWAAWHWRILWGDTLLYLHASETLNQGDLHGAFSEFGLNLYTVILAGLLKLGGDWQTNARCWSVAMATLTVLPLWGWVRRVFDDRIALIACLCYAFHGKLVAIAPLIIRDSTFWLLFAATLYAMWRAVVEVRWRWFLAAGVALTLAMHTRTEGWLLVVVLLGWCAGRLRPARDARLRLVAGTVLCLAVVPLSVAGVNAMWLRGDPHWDLLRPQHLKIFRDWWQSCEAPPAAAPASPASAAAPAPAPAHASPVVEELSFGSEVWSRHWSSATFNRKLLVRLVRGFTYTGGLLALLGMMSWWRGVLRREHLALLLMCLILLAMIRIRYVLAGIDIRYFMPLVLLSLPWMALGFLELVRWTSWAFTPRIGTASAWRRGFAVGLAVLAIGGSLADAGLPGARLMENQAAIGRWIFEHLGPDRRVGGYFLGLDMVAYYAKGTTAGYVDPHVVGRQGALDQAGRFEADVLLVSLECPDAEICVDLASRIEQKYHFRQVPEDQLPAECKEVRVLIRPGAGSGP